MRKLVEKLDQDNVILESVASDPQLVAELSRYGGVEYLNEGMQLCQLARQLVDAQMNARLAKVTANRSLQSAWKEAKFKYNIDLSLARAAFKGSSEIRYRLQLDGERANGFGEWYVQARAFYLGLQSQPALSTMVEPLGLTAERINRGVGILQVLEGIRIQKHEEQSSAVDAMQQRNEALEAFNQWMFTFRGITRYQFATDLTSLTKLGIRSPLRKPALKKRIETPVQKRFVLPGKLPSETLPLFDLHDLAIAA